MVVVVLIIIVQQVNASGLFMTTVLSSTIVSPGERQERMPPDGVFRRPVANRARIRRVLCLLVSQLAAALNVPCRHPSFWLGRLQEHGKPMPWICKAPRNHARP